MRFRSISPDNQRRLAIAMPIAALLLSLFVVYPTWGRYTALLSTLTADRKALDVLKASPRPDVGPIRAVEEGLPSESPGFLGQVRRLAQLSGCRMKGFDVSAGPAQPVGIVRAVRSHVELEGRYPQIRDFLLRVVYAPRLYVVTECTVVPAATTVSAVGRKEAGSAPGTLRASIEIERYVTPPPP